MAEDKTNVPGALEAMKITRFPNPNRQTHYANNTIVIANQWDVQLNFALIHEIAPGQVGSFDEVLVIMTPEHALAFSKALQSSLESFSRSQGPIRVVTSPEAPVSPEKSS